LESGLALCGLATRFARAIGADDRKVYDLSLTSHIGCTAESHVIARLTGDELRMREHGQLVDFGNPRQTFGFIVAHARRQFPAHEVPFAVARAVAGVRDFRAGAQAVCEAGRLLTADLGLGLDADL